MIKTLFIAVNVLIAAVAQRLYGLVGATQRRTHSLLLLRFGFNDVKAKQDLL
ncbi:MAG: hypothetical protein Q9M17_03845 [Mariprofundus sp.]|nr:hypothetical protein [Mariprofundus sp.]